MHDGPAHVTDVCPQVLTLIVDKCEELVACAEKDEGRDAFVQDTLFWSCMAKDLFSIKFALDYGSSPIESNTGSETQQTPIHITAEMSSVQVRRSPPSARGRYPFSLVPASGVSHHSRNITIFLSPMLRCVAMWLR